MRVFAVCVALAGVLSGCASSPVSPKGTAIYDALQTETSLRAWSDACADVSLESRKLAGKAKEAWWRRNRTLLESADFGLAYDLASVTNTRVDTGARLAMGLTWQVVEAAEADVASRLEPSTSKSSVCEKVLTQYRDGDFDLTENESTYQALLELQNRKNLQGEDLALRRAAIEKETGKVYGRSFYVVEKLAKRYSCPGAEVHLLDNRWPNEVYDARCNNGSFLIFRCEWGNCMIVD